VGGFRRGEYDALTAVGGEIHVADAVLIEASERGVAVLGPEGEAVEALAACAQEAPHGLLTGQGRDELNGETGGVEDRGLDVQGLLRLDLVVQLPAEGLVVALDGGIDVVDGDAEIDELVGLANSLRSEVRSE
jgi:hypothetical protein